MLPLYSIQQGVIHSGYFDALPGLIGSYPNLVIPESLETPFTKRNVTGICDDPILVDRWRQIVYPVNTENDLDGIVVGYRLFPANVACLTEPHRQESTRHFDAYDFPQGEDNLLASDNAWGLDAGHTAFPLWEMITTGENERAHILAKDGPCGTGGRRVVHHVFETGIISSLPILTLPPPRSPPFVLNRSIHQQEVQHIRAVCDASHGRLHNIISRAFVPSFIIDLTQRSSSYRRLSDSPPHIILFMRILDVQTELICGHLALWRNPDVREASIELGRRGLQLADGLTLDVNDALDSLTNGTASEGAEDDGSTGLPDVLNVHGTDVEGAWGFVVNFLDWTKLKDRSDIYQRFANCKLEFRLSRVSGATVEDVDTDLLAQSPNYASLDESNSVVITTESLHGTWENRVGSIDGWEGEFSPPHLCMPIFRMNTFWVWDSPLTITVVDRVSLSAPWYNSAVVCVVLGSLLFGLLTASTLVERQLHRNLLYKMMPKRAIAKLRRGQTVLEKFNLVTIFFSDIVGFTSMAGNMRPIQVMKMLNELYTELEKLVKKHQVYKVETIGDAYMVVGGAPDRVPAPLAAERVALFAIDAIEFVKTFRTKDGDQLFIRAGLASGPTVAG